MKSSKEKIIRLSRLLKIVFFLAALSWPLMNAGFWLSNGFAFLKPWINWDLIPKMEGVLIPAIEHLSASTKFLAFLASAIPLLFNMFAFLQLAKLFQSFERLEFFSGATVACLKKIGLCILFNQLFYPIYIGLLSFILTFSNPVGERVIQVAFEGSQLQLFIIAISILLISRVMDEGRKIQEEHSATI